MATQKRRPKLVLRDADPSVRPESLAVYTLDKAGKILGTAAVGEKGDFDLSADAVAKAARVVVAPAAEGKEPPDLTKGVAFHAFEIAERFRAGEALELGPAHIGILYPPQRCAEGSLRHCWPFDLAVKNLAAEVKQSVSLAKFATVETASIADTLSVSKATAQILPIFPRCRPVCDGVVEVYRRTCCCSPIIYLDPRIELLKERLRELAQPIPKFRVPIPEPDPSPIAEAILNTGTVDQLQINAAADLQALSILPPAEQVQYINVRPYLFHLCCHCDPPQRVGTGYMRPDGTFRICFTEFRSRLFCWNTYAFVIKQVINGSTVTIYDGVASNTWFSDITDVDLVTYHPQTINCAEPEPTVNPNAVFLQDVGLTPAWRLGKPTNGINPGASYAPIFTHGLINPGGLGGGIPNRNLGGTLLLRYFISESLRGTAKYYRLSYVPSTNLAATPVVLPSLTWNYVEIVGSNVNVVPYPLGTLGNLSEIPYWHDHAWMSGQYHGQFNTNGLAPGWYVMILELFNASGNPITSGINYVNWNTSTTTDPVPFNKLLVPFYVDNRSCYGDINTVTAPLSTNPDPDCLYLAGAAGDPVQFQYRAGFPDPNFLLSYRLWVKRGLTGAEQTLVSATTNSSPDPWATAGTTVGALLGSRKRCAFAANLHVYAKTTDGIYDLTNGAYDQIAFSLEQS